LKKVLLIGAGDVGTHLLEFAARDESNIEPCIVKTNSLLQSLHLINVG